VFLDDFFWFDLIISMSCENSLPRGNLGLPRFDAESAISAQREAWARQLRLRSAERPLAPHDRIVADRRFVNPLFRAEPKDKRSPARPRLFRPITKQRPAQRRPIALRRNRRRFL
jgi:hypothetical protein